MTAAQRAALSPALFNAMVARAERIITADWALAWDHVRLVSGGAAWSDHVAVELFLRHVATSNVQLTIFSPCGWAPSTGRFLGADDTGNWRLANRYHDAFATVRGESSFADLRAAGRSGGEVYCRHVGFRARNTAIAQAAQRALAFSWASGDAPDAGGTLDTWNKLPASVVGAHRVHVPMAGLVALVGEKKRPRDEEEPAAAADNQA